VYLEQHRLLLFFDWAVVSDRATLAILLGKVADAEKLLAKPPAQGSVCPNAY
jgi:hypothetical protein